jgi:cell division protein FtsB
VLPTVVAGVTARGSSRIAKQIAVLGLVICAVALSLAYPLRNYLGQRADLAAAVAQQRSLEQQVADLEVQKAALSDPEYIKAQAKERLQYVKPGETVYVVQAPTQPDAGSAGSATAKADTPWYTTLWDTLSANPGAAVSPGVLDQPVAPANRDNGGTLVPAPPSDESVPTDATTAGTAATP